VAAGQGEAMSAPSKEDVEFWNAVNACVAACGGDTGRVTMARMNAVAAVESSRRKLVVENERLRAENDKLMADALARQTTEIALRAECAECLALLGKVEASRVVLHSPLGSVSREDVSALVAKLRGQS